jgi:hypothetical protein
MNALDNGGIALGEYYAIVNTDKEEYIDGGTLGMSVKLDGLIGSPLPEILVWLLADGRPVSGQSPMQGSWAGDRIVVAGDEGRSAPIWERAQAGFRDITVQAFEALAEACPYICFKYEEEGLLDQEGKFVRDWAVRQKPTNDGTLGLSTTVNTRTP